MKYGTLKQLADAYNGGQLARDKAVLVLDNDHTGVYDQSGGERVFEMHPEDLLTQALSLLGIPYDHA